MWDDISEPSAAHLHLILDIVDAVFQHFVFYFHQDSSQSDSWLMAHRLDGCYKTFVILK